jgi:hypothetical protein
MTLAGVDPSQRLVVIEDAKHAIDPLATPPFAARPDVTAKPPFKHGLSSLIRRGPPRSPSLAHLDSGTLPH